MDPQKPATVTAGNKFVTGTPLTSTASTTPNELCWSLVAVSRKLRSHHALARPKGQRLQLKHMAFVE